MNKINAMKRLKEEYISASRDPSNSIGITFSLPIEDNYFQWKIILVGPRGTSYEGGLFMIYINFPDDYPNSCPKFVFETPIYHINVNPIKSDKPGAAPLGHVFSPLSKYWKPEYKMFDVIMQLYAYIFYMADPDSPYGLDRVNEFRFNKALYEEKIKYFTKKYNIVGTNEDNFESWDFFYP